MRLQHLDLNLLVSLNALLTERGVAAAAECVNLTPSAMSHALARLRQHFDDELLIPAGRRFVLTSRAEALALPVREALLQIERLLEGPQAFEPAASTRNFTILASDYALSVFLARAVARMKAIAPLLQFEIAQPDDAQQRLTSGEADLIVLPQQHLAPDHPSATLFRDEYVSVMWSGSALAQRDLDLDRYFALGHVAVQFGRRAEDTDALGLAAPRARRVEVTAQSFALLPQLLVGNELIATLPQRLAALAAQSLPLSIKPLPFVAPPIHECVQWNRSRADDAATAWVVQQLHASLA
jgi:DNA-binding transcriptional LysR family regulator